MLQKLVMNLMLKISVKSKNQCNLHKQILVSSSLFTLVYRFSFISKNTRKAKLPYSRAQNNFLTERR